MRNHYHEGSLPDRDVLANVAQQIVDRIRQGMPPGFRIVVALTDFGGAFVGVGSNTTHEDVLKILESAHGGEDMRFAACPACTRCKGNGHHWCKVKRENYFSCKHCPATAPACAHCGAIVVAHCTDPRCFARTERDRAKSKSRRPAAR